VLDRTTSAAAEWDRVGDQLRGARERLGMTLVDLSRRTRIKPSLLAALEQGDVEKLPRGPFRRGFARAYALEVGLDAERLLKHFESEPTPPAPSTPPPHDRQQLSSSSFVSRLAVCAAIVAAAVAVPRWILSSGDPSVGAPTLAAVGTGGVQPADAGQTPATSLTTQPQVAVGGPTVTLGLRAVDEVWVQADVDGQRLAYGLIPAGTERTFVARTSLSLRIGDAGAVEYTIDGVRGAPLGPRGFVRELHLTPRRPPR
jgi:transcriptional regulator with XRE-family HTH domain